MSRWLARLRARLRILFERQRLERELDAELRFHNDQQASEYLKQGLSSEEAVRAARSDREPRLHRGVGGVAREGTHARRRGLPLARRQNAQGSGQPTTAERRVRHRRSVGPSRLCGVNLAFLWLSTLVSFRETVGVAPSVSSVGAEWTSY